MDNERMRVLELLERGTITAAEAADLLHALEGGSEGRERPPRRGPARDARDAKEPKDARGAGDQPKWFRVRVTDNATGRPKANVSIPYGMVNFGLRFAPNRIRLRHGSQHVDDLLDALRTGKRGTLYDVTDKNESERIEIIVE